MRRYANINHQPFRYSCKMAQPRSVNGIERGQSPPRSNYSFSSAFWVEWQSTLKLATGSHELNGPFFFAAYTARRSKQQARVASTGRPLHLQAAFSSPASSRTKRRDTYNPAVADRAVAPSCSSALFPSAGSTPRMFRKVARVRSGSRISPSTGRCRRCERGGIGLHSFGYPRHSP